jgi:putative zinc-dependent peptidase DUF5700
VIAIRGSPRRWLATAGLVGAVLFSAPRLVTAEERVQLQVDPSEAQAVLAILRERSEGKTVAEADWRRLFESEPYIRLKKREESLHRAFTDEDFRKFVLSGELAAQAPELERTLEQWVKADLTAAARRVLAYLPERAVIRAKVYPVIKPQKNSFVFETQTDPAIFLYLDPKVAAPKFENTVAHELHHIGYASVERPEAEPEANASTGIRAAVNWMSAFGEGFAMLAAAGSPDVHPHAVSAREERERWDRDMANLPRDFKALEKFFLDVIRGKLKTKEEVEKKAYSFFGIQGPWYTVGYEMAVIIERREGRAVLIECMSNPRRLLATYNRDAAALNAAGKERLPLWSKELLAGIGAAPEK